MVFRSERWLTTREIADAFNNASFRLGVASERQVLIESQQGMEYFNTFGGSPVACRVVTFTFRSLFSPLHTRAHTYTHARTCMLWSVADRTNCKLVRTGGSRCYQTGKAATTLLGGKQTERKRRVTLTVAEKLGNFLMNELRELAKKHHLIGESLLTFLLPSSNPH